jgi:hypothetical protein
MYADDCDKRMKLAKIILGWSDDWLQLLENLLWHDKGVFHIGRLLNQHNCHYWTADNPGHHVVRVGRGSGCLKGNRLVWYHIHHSCFHFEGDSEFCKVL